MNSITFQKVAFCFEKSQLSLTISEESIQLNIEMHTQLDR